MAELAEAGITRESITDVVLTHLHFDHAGGALRQGEDGLEPVFPNARHWVQKRHWDWAARPERARPRQLPAATTSARWRSRGCCSWSTGPAEIMPRVRVTPVSGHTPGQQIVEFHTGPGRARLRAAT